MPLDTNALKAIMYGWNPPMKDDVKGNKVPKLEFKWTIKEDVTTTHNSWAIQGRSFLDLQTRRLQSKKLNISRL